MKNFSFNKLVAKVLTVAMMLNMQNTFFMQRVFADTIENQIEIADEEKLSSYREEVGENEVTADEEVADVEGLAKLAHT